MNEDGSGRRYGISDQQGVRSVHVLDRLGQKYNVGMKRGGTIEVEYEPIYWSRVVHRFPQLDPVVQDTRK